MKRTVIGLAVVFGALALGAGIYLYRHNRPLPRANTGYTPDLVNQLPSDAPAIAYVNVAALRELRNSPLAAVLGLGSSGPEADREYAEFVRQTGFDYTRDLDKLALAAWPESFADAAGPQQENRALAIASGRFDQKKIEAYALRNGRAVTHNSQPVYEVPGNPTVRFVFQSTGRMALASGKNGEELLTANGARARDAAMDARIARVAGAPIFAVARTTDLPESFYKNFSNSPQLERLVRSIRGLSLAGQPDKDAIKVALDAECDSNSSALQLATLLDILRMSSSIALSDPKTRRQMTKPQAALVEALVRRVKVTHQDEWVRLTLEVTPEMLGLTSAGPTAQLPQSRTYLRP